MYTYVQMKKGSSEHAECLKEQILSYYKELDEQHGRKTAEDFLLSVIESTLAMQGPHDRHLEIGFAEGEAVGFLYGKVDHEGHKGFIKPGWGYIMEFYVHPLHRRQGIGRVMFQRMEDYFALHGVSEMYLTSSPVTGVPFWKAMGFHPNGEISPENGQPIWTKKVKNSENSVTIAQRSAAMLEFALSPRYKAVPAATEQAVFVCKFYVQNKDALHGKNISLDEWEKILSKNDPDEENFLICQGAVPVAWMRLNGLCSKETAWVSMLAVSSARHRQGVGSFALQYAEIMLQSRGFCRLKIHTTTDNIPACNLYQKLGYTVANIDECITGDGIKRARYTYEKKLA